MNSHLGRSIFKMLESVAAECHKKGQTVLHFVNAAPKVAKSIMCTLPSADIAFLPKVRLNLLYKDQSIANLQVQIVSRSIRMTSRRKFKCKKPLPKWLCSV